MSLQVKKKKGPPAYIDRLIGSSLIILLATACRKFVVKIEEIFYDIMHGVEYSSLSGHQQLIIREGFTRMMCLSKAYLIYEPEKVTDECQNYTSYL